MTNLSLVPEIANYAGNNIQRTYKEKIIDDASN